MKALTLHQPWASLVALGVKTIETRSWPCPPSLIGQPLAIHAGLTKADWRDPVWGPLIEPGTACILRVGLRPLPLGAVVATCRVDGSCTDLDDQRPYGDFRPGRYAWLLEDVKPTTERCPACWLVPSRNVDQRTGVRYVDDGYGNPYRCPSCDGRGRGCPPVPARGRQRVWNWEVA